jgi:hypothetical protein
MAEKLFCDRGQPETSFLVLVQFNTRRRLIGDSPHAKISVCKGQIVILLHTASGQEKEALLDKRSLVPSGNLLDVQGDASLRYSVYSYNH